MKILCADCGCLVDRGVRLQVCAIGAECCCGELPMTILAVADGEASSDDPN